MTKLMGTEQAREADFKSTPTLPHPPDPGLYGSLGLMGDKGKTPLQRALLKGLNQKGRLEDKRWSTFPSVPLPSTSLKEILGGGEGVNSSSSSFYQELPHPHPIHPIHGAMEVTEANRSSTGRR